MIIEKNTQNLLSQVNTIVNSYEKVAQATGENFNIFSILGIEHYEVGTHSKFLAHLLNPKGKHGLGSRFLELFLIKIGAQEHLDFNATSCKVEYYIGEKSIKDCENIKLEGMKMASEGGFIDIYLKDKRGKSISIENKIYAKDQEKQIVRYYNYNKEYNRVFYLTLDGKDADIFSKGGLISNIDKNLQEDEEPNFYCFSYKNTILEWLETCQKEASDRPILRETIKQYKNLIKKLTYQNINSQMNKEILKLVTSDKDSFESWRTLIGLTNSIVNDTIKTIVIPILKDLKEEFEKKYATDGLSFKIDEDRLSSKKIYNPLLMIYSNQLKKNNFRMLFQFQSNNNDNLIGGFNYLDASKAKEFEKTESIKSNFKEIFTNIPTKENGGWAAYFEYNHYMNWTDNKNDLSNLIFGNFKEDLKQKIELMLGIVSHS